MVPRFGGGDGDHWRLHGGVEGPVPQFLERAAFYNYAKLHLKLLFSVGMDIDLVNTGIESVQADIFSKVFFP